MREKKIKFISASTNEDLEDDVNKFFNEMSDMRWRLVAVTSGSGYRTAWLEFDPT